MRTSLPGHLVVALFSLGCVAACIGPTAIGPQVAAAGSDAVRSRPNIVFVLADDMGYGDVAALNAASKIATPNLDRLAAEGMSFVDAHTPSSVCTPTRYGVMTGRYCWRGQLKRGVINGYGGPVIERGRATVASLLSGSGYYTCMVGKWHLGLEWPRRSEPGVAKGKRAIDFTKPVGGVPNRYGFDHSYIIPASLDFPPYVYIDDGRVTAATVVEQPAQRFPAFLRKGPRGDDVVMEEVLGHLVDHACELIQSRSHSVRPFFLYLPLPAPHKPVLPHPDYRGKTGLGDYGDFIAQVDGAVGSVLQAIDDAGLKDNTLVVYTSDNGSFMHRFNDPKAGEPQRKDHVEDSTVQGYRPEHHRANGDLRGTKADIWEAGHRVPFFCRWPSVVAPGSTCDATVCLTDFFATCADVVDIALADDMAEDSFSLVPRLRGVQPEVARAPVVHHSVAGMFAIRRGKWKLVLGNGSGGRQRPKGKPFGEPFQLFDLEVDLGETRDVASEHPEVVAELADELDAIRKSGRSR